MVAFTFSRYLTIRARIPSVFESREFLSVLRKCSSDFSDSLPRHQTQHHFLTCEKMTVSLYTKRKSCTTTFYPRVGSLVPDFLQIPRYQMGRSAKSNVEHVLCPAFMWLAYQSVERRAVNDLHSSNNNHPPADSFFTNSCISLYQNSQ